MGEVGARLEALTSTAATFDTTAQAATESGQHGATQAERLHGQIDELTTTMANDFQSMAESFRDHMHRTQQQLHATEWSGQRREKAVQIGEQFEADVRTVLQQAEEGVDTFRTQTTRAASDFVGAIRSGFQSAMDRANASLTNLGQELRTTRDQLEQIDAASTISYG